MTRPRQLPSEPGIDLLMESSKELLEELQLKRWELVCQLLREREELQNEIDRLMSEALNARWLLSNRDAILAYRQIALPFEPMKVDSGPQKVSQKVNERG